MTGSRTGKNKFGWLRRFIALLALLCAVLAVLTETESTFGDTERNIEKYAVRRVQPSYPPNAQKYKIEGTVTIQVTVDSNGKVYTAEFIRGNNVFRSVSLDAAKRWEFKLPSSENNQGIIYLNFKLGQ